MAPLRSSRGRSDGERLGLVAAVAEREETDQLRLHGEDDVLGVGVGGDQLGDPVQPGDLVAAVLGRSPVPAGIGDDLGDEEADHEEQHRGRDVVRVVDLQRLVRMGEEEVERHRGDDGRERTAHAGADRGAEHDHDDEDQHDVGAGEVVAERYEDARHEQGAEGGDRQADRSSCVTGGCVMTCHASGIRLPRRTAKSLDAVLTRSPETFTRRATAASRFAASA